ncbi:MAG: diaminopimelate epimerase [Tannerellaceae bacterium]|nr:diaminopimelate epimerase [Tannerellaceae bacterium]
MTQNIQFTKMHGTGNDYIYINMLEFPLQDPEKLSIRWSTFHTGIGSDGLVLIDKSEIADFSMRIFNADGSEAMMCGNATRCIGKYVYEKGLTDKQIVTLETLSGIKTLNLQVTNEEVTEVTVDMGKPEIGERDLSFQVEGHSFQGTIISMGNPHLVIFVDDVEKIELDKVGPLLEHHSLFPNRTNVEFVQILEEDILRMRVWERGSGITQACGTGACATAIAAIIRGKSSRKVKIIMDGGPLDIEWDETTGNIFMTGEAVIVFEGSIRL